jgi:hypothetical protein
VAGVVFGERQSRDDEVKPFEVEAADRGISDCQVGDRQRIERSREDTSHRPHG